MDVNCRKNINNGRGDSRNSTGASQTATAAGTLAKSTYTSNSSDAYNSWDASNLSILAKYH
jgi:hypothetical protein